MKVLLELDASAYILFFKKLCKFLFFTEHNYTNFLLYGLSLYDYFLVAICFYNYLIKTERNKGRLLNKLIVSRIIKQFVSV